MRSERESPLRTAASFFSAGNLEEAKRWADRALKAEPNGVEVLILRGRIAFQTGELNYAVELLRKASSISPRSFDAHFWLANVYRRSGLVGEAIESAQSAVEITPAHAQAQNLLGLSLVDARLLTQAEACFRIAVFQASHVPQVRYNLSRCLQRQGRLEEAEVEFAETLKLVDLSPQGLEKFASVLLAEGNSSAAAESAQALLKKRRSPYALTIMARALVELGKSMEARESVEEALAMDPTNPDSFSLLGTTLQGLGDFDGAESAFRRSIELLPIQGFGYFGLAFNRKVGAEFEYVSAMTDLCDSRKIDPKSLSSLNYGLGKVHEDLGNYQESILRYDAANALEYRIKFGSKSFDPVSYARLSAWVEKFFDANFLAENEALGNSSNLPLFVVGMMRSGTTLIEQLLSGHPEIAAAGELPFWSDNWRGILSPNEKKVDTLAIEVLTERYLKQLAAIGDGALRVVDKMPVNYAQIGSIHTALPRAKIIHMRRDPVDTCLSVYLTPNRAPIEFAHNRENIVAGFREYEKLMAHWGKVLSPRVVLDVAYEDLVSEPEATMRQVLDFCDLEWDSNCIHPETNLRPVSTPSLWQVRQPINRGAMGRWKKFEPWIPEFLNIKKS